MTTHLIPQAIRDVLNEPQLETLEEYLQEHPDYVESLINVSRMYQGEELRETLIDKVVIPINAQKFKRQTQERAAQGYWSVQGVFGEDDQPAFAYTMGLSAHTPYELFASGINTNTLGEILNDLGQRLKDNPELTEEDLNTPFRPLGHIEDGTPVRVRLQKIPMLIEDQPTPVMTEFCTGITNTFGIQSSDKQLIILTLPDAENRLPGEEGYDVTFRQYQFTEHGERIL